MIVGSTVIQVSVAPRPVYKMQEVHVHMSCIHGGLPDLSEKGFIVGVGQALYLNDGFNQVRYLALKVGILSVHVTRRVL